MDYFLAGLKSGCKSLKFVIQQAMPQGPEQDEALQLLRTIYRLGKESLAAAVTDFDHAVALLEAEEEEALGERLCWDTDTSTRSPVVKGTLITVEHVNRLLYDGWETSDILRTHPELTEEDIEACLNYDNPMGADE